MIIDLATPEGRGLLKLAKLGSHIHGGFRGGLYADPKELTPEEVYKDIEDAGTMTYEHNGKDGAWSEDQDTQEALTWLIENNIIL